MSDIDIVALSGRERAALKLKGRAAWKRLKEYRDWDDWLQVRVALRVGRQECMDKTESPTPRGRAYNEAFGAWLTAEGYSDLADSARSDLFWIGEHLDEVLAWRKIKEKAGHDLTEWNHPSTVRRHYLADTTKAVVPVGEVENHDAYSDSDEDPWHSNEASKKHKKKGNKRRTRGDYENAIFERDEKINRLDEEIRNLRKRVGHLEHLLKLANARLVEAGLEPVRDGDDTDATMDKDGVFQFH